jgi:glycine/D-amino acid oxidase-like deaminating enzyme
MAGVMIPVESRKRTAFVFSVDLRLFDKVIRPTLSCRVQGFERMTLQRSWAGHYGISTLEQNAFIGAPATSSNFC